MDTFESVKGLKTKSSNVDYKALQEKDFQPWINQWEIWMNSDAIKIRMGIHKMGENVKLLSIVNTNVLHWKSRYSIATPRTNAPKHFVGVKISKLPRPYLVY